MSQPVLFDTPQSAVRRAPAKPPLDAGLDDWALLYTATELGNHSGIRFALSVPDAMIWCDSDVSRGILSGTRWAYFWTRASTFLGVYPPPLDIRGLVDSGEWDQRIADLGLTKWPLPDFPRLFGPLGIEVLA